MRCSQMISYVCMVSEKMQYTSCFRRTCLLAVLCLMAALVSIGTSCPEVSATDYYLDRAPDSTDPDSGDGTKENPWNYINAVSLAAANKFVAGDRIKFKRGSIFHGSLWIKWSGASEDPIVFESYEDGNPNDPLPIIDGSRDVVWTDTVNNIYSAGTVSDREPNILNYNGAAKPPITTLRLDSVPSELAANAVLLLSDPYGSFWVRSVNGNTVSGITRAVMHTRQSLSFRYLEDGKEKNWSGNALTIDELISTGIDAKAGLTEWGDWYWDTTDNRVYLYSDVVPDNDTVRVSWYWDTVRVDIAPGTVHDVIIQDLHVQKANKQGVVLYYCSSITVQRLNIFGNAKTAVQLWNADDNIIQNNTIDSNSGGVSLYAPAGLQTKNNQVRNNTVTNCRGACIGLSRDQAANPGEVSGNVIYGNTITNANTMGYDGAGVYTFYAGSNTIESNIIRNCGSKYLRSAGVMVDMSAAPMTITGNTIENNSNGGIAVSGAGHQITNNTLRNNGVSTMDRPQVGFFFAGTTASNCTVTHNTMIADQGYHFIKAEPGSTSGHYINYNAYTWTSTKQFLWPWPLPTSSPQWMDFETWQDQTRHDLNSTSKKKSTIFLFLNGWIHRR